MITPAQVTKSASHNVEKTKTAGPDGRQWQQALQDAAAPEGPAIKPPARIAATSAAPGVSAAAPPATAVPVVPLPRAKITSPVSASDTEPVTTKKTDLPAIVPANAAILTPPPTAWIDPKPQSASNNTHGDHIAADALANLAAAPTASPALASPVVTSQPAASQPTMIPTPTPAMSNAINSEKSPLPRDRSQPTIATSAALQVATTFVMATAPVTSPAGLPIKPHDATALAAITPVTATTASLTVNEPSASTMVMPAPVNSTPIAPDAASLAAAVTALHQSGQTTATMRLDPPGLGNLTIHLGAGENNAVNVLFIAAVPQTTQIIANHLNDLRQAMDNAGLSLGNAQVGSNSAGGGNGNPPDQPRPTPQLAPPVPTSAATPPGIRAYA